MKLLHEYAGQPVKGWLWSEKYDGVRLHWDGVRFTTRTGRTPAAPSWAVNLMPHGVRVDAELWAGRGRFGCALSAIQTGNWSGCHLVVFDAVVPGGIAERMAQAVELVGDDDRVQFAEYRRVANPDTCLAGVADSGGEGIVLCHPSAEYMDGRTTDCLKYKMRDTVDLRVLSVHRRCDGRPSSVSVRVGKLTQKIANHIEGIKPGDTVEVTYEGDTRSGRLRNGLVSGVKPAEGVRAQMLDARGDRSVSEIARDAGLARANVSNFLNGKADLSGSSLEKLIAAMGGRIVFDG